jgi:hypothetical protein
MSSTITVRKVMTSTQEARKQTFPATTTLWVGRVSLGMRLNTPGMCRCAIRFPWAILKRGESATTNSFNAIN